jgi:glycosyltransferase involved in cell wall biosynthesis
MKLSILTPSIPSRALYLDDLSAKIDAQIGDRKDVEHLVFLDNKRRTIGEKRQALLEIAKGDYIAYCDDDDDILPGYIEEILKAIEQVPHVVTFRQTAYFNAQAGDIEFRLGHSNDEWVPGKLATRGAWHVCAWWRQLALQSKFPAINYGEDWAWCERLNKMAETEVHIPKLLHVYRYDKNVSEANP